MSKSSADDEGNFDPKQSSFRLISPKRTSQVNENKSHAEYFYSFSQINFIFNSRQESVLQAKMSFSLLPSV